MTVCTTKFQCSILYVNILGYSAYFNKLWAKISAFESYKIGPWLSKLEIRKTYENFLGSISGSFWIKLKIIFFQIVLQTRRRRRGRGRRRRRQRQHRRKIRNRKNGAKIQGQLSSGRRINNSVAASSTSSPASPSHDDRWSRGLHPTETWNSCRTKTWSDSDRLGPDNLAK